MEKKKIELFITAGLVAVLIIAAANAVRTTAKKRQAMNAYSQMKPAPIQVSSPAAEKKDEVMPEGAETDKETMPAESVYRDPFTRQAGASSSGAYPKRSGRSGILLTGIVYDTGNPAASRCIINGRLLKAGDCIENFMISGIKEDFIILSDEKEGKDYSLGILGDLE